MTRIKRFFFWPIFRVQRIKPIQPIDRINVQSLAADIVSRLPAMIHDSPINSANLVAGLIQNAINEAKNQ